MSESARLQLPVTPYETGDFRGFGERIRRRVFLWATRLGDDVAASAGTPVQAIGEGEVVWSEMREGSADKRNWGGVVILAHRREKHQDTRDKQQTNSKDQISNTQKFYSVYGHMQDLRVEKRERVEKGQTLGVVAEGSTPENGMWVHPHLHFAIYTGPWRDRILPGYARPDDWLRPGATRRTRKSWWHDPRQFIEEYNKLLAS